MQPFSYPRADDTDTAIALLATDPEAAFVASGTTLLDLMKDHVLKPRQLVDITRLPLGRRGDNQ